MKSTGLFGKNSGRVGGVVYSNYRGAQVVRTYQPQVKNPNSMGQVAQRAKFKLVSQIGAVFGSELKSFVPSKSNESPRNAWVRAMLKKTIYQSLQKEASLPVEDIVLTSSKQNVFDPNISIQGDSVDIVLNNDDWKASGNTKVHIVEVGWNESGEIAVTFVRDINVDEEGDASFTIWTQDRNQYKYVNALVFAYKPMATGTNVSYSDYDMTTTEATLTDMQNMFGSGLEYSRTLNLPIPSNV